MPLPKAIPTGTDPQAFVCREPHWWDASQLYGTHPDYVAEIEREHGEIAVDDDLLRALERQAANFNAPEASLWVGLAALLVLFAHEHNAIVRHLRAAYPEQGAPWLYAKARLVNSALMAKIHTVEWTPAIIGHPTTVGAIKATWWGLRGHEHRAHSRHEGESPRCAVRADRGVRDGLPAAPAAARRLRARRQDPEPARARGPARQRRPAARAHRRGGRERRRAVRARARSRPARSSCSTTRRRCAAGSGSATCRRSTSPRPTSCAHARRACRGTPRSASSCACPCRRRSRSSPAATRTRAAAIREVYDGNLDAVDAVVGLYAEPKPQGFAFSETAFRIFLLMAARRLQSDRFFTDDYTPETYTPEGLAGSRRRRWATCIRRTYPQLTPPGEPVPASGLQNSLELRGRVLR